MHFHLALGDSIVVQSEKLRNFQGCTATQQKQIISAWYEAMSMVAYVKYDLDFELYAEVDFFGPLANTASAQKNIRGITICHK